jgi:hypothetical protein
MSGRVVRSHLALADLEEQSEYIRGTRDVDRIFGWEDE